MAALPNKLYTLYVFQSDNQSIAPLVLHFTSENRHYDAAFELKRAGFKVAGEYLGALSLNPTPAGAVETARAFFKNGD